MERGTAARQRWQWRSDLLARRWTGRLGFGIGGGCHFLGAAARSEEATEGGENGGEEEEEEEEEAQGGG